MKNIKEYVKDVKTFYKTNPYFQYFLNNRIYFTVIQVGDNEASTRYVRNKIKDLNEIGITNTRLVHMPETSTEAELKDILGTFYRSTGLMVQLPLPSHINVNNIIPYINKAADVDAFTEDALVKPCTPMGIITYLERNGFCFEGKRAVVIGRSNLVGKPAAALLEERGCEVAVVHSKTSEEERKELYKNADLIICATGHRNTLTKAYEYKPTAVIFDVGIDFDENGKMVGDCEPNLPVAFQSPVPGGVGLLTRLQVIENLYMLKAYKDKNNYNYEQTWTYR